MQQNDFETAGFALVPAVLSPALCTSLGEKLQLLSAQSAGDRSLLSATWCADVVAQLRTHPRLRELLPRDALAVQCTYFEKSVERNWLVAMHQDLSIPVAARVAHTELRGWSEKDGNLFVQAPPQLLQELLAVRLHLDDCGAADGPLRVVPGSHRLGVLPTAEQSARAAETVSCIAAAGDVLVMRPLLLHASSKASGSSLRRVLHLLFGPPQLPFGLRWAQAL